jgi:hypothetical protein
VHHNFTRTAVIIISLFLIAIATPVIAQDVPPVLENPDLIFDHTIIYDIGGLITINRQLGDKSSTGAVKYTTVRGYGEMTKVENVRIAANIIKIDEISDWNVPVDAINGLTVTTVIDLASRPMATAAHVYNENGYDIEEGDIINIYHPLVVSGDLEVDRLTQQLWSTRLVTNPGHSGGYHADFIAAYGPGPYEREYGITTDMGDVFFYDEKYMWTYEVGIHPNDRDDRRDGYDRGDYYVGNYFSIDQYAYTSGGEMQRLISMSNPFENTLLIEDLSVIGSAAVRESFENHGLIGGPKAVTLAWYELF